MQTFLHGPSVVVVLLHVNCCTVPVWQYVTYLTHSTLSRMPPLQPPGGAVVVMGANGQKGGGGGSHPLLQVVDSNVQSRASPSHAHTPRPVHVLTAPTTAAHFALWNATTRWCVTATVSVLP